MLISELVVMEKLAITPTYLVIKVRPVLVLVHTLLEVE